MTFEHNAAECLGCSQGMEAVHKKLMDTIIERGHAVASIHGSEDGPPFSYTVGRTLKGRPELFITGPIDARIQMAILNDAVRVDEETPLKPGQERDGLLQRFSTRIVEIDPQAASMFVARNFFGDDVRALQIVWPDPDGRFPGDPRFSFPADHQPVFTKGGS